jgi:hypothetical protein
MEVAQVVKEENEYREKIHAQQVTATESVGQIRIGESSWAQYTVINLRMQLPVAREACCAMAFAHAGSGIGHNVSRAKVAHRGALI